MKREPEPVYPVRRMVYPFLHAGPYTVEGLAYIDGIWLNPNNITFIRDVTEKRFPKGGSAMLSIHFVGGERITVDGETDRAIWRIDSALALQKKGDAS